jgi:SAM-dependent methyltransferase
MAVAAPIDRPQRHLPDLGVLPALLEAHVRAHYTPHRLQNGRLPLATIHGETLRELSELFTSERESLPPGYLARPRYRGAYLLYFVPTGVATVLAVLNDARALRFLTAPPEEPGATRPTTVRVLDVGAGPLTASLALALALPAGVQLEVVAVDSAAAIMEDGRALIQAVRPGTKVRLVSGNVRDGRTLTAAGSGFDVILMANILNEWPVGGRKASTPADFVSAVLTDRLAPGGVAVLVEPGTRAGSHELIEVREHLLDVGPDLAILAPCMGTAPCPLAGSTRDWCHSEQPWERPQLVQNLDTEMGHRRGTLKFSHLVLADRPEANPQPSRYRVIGGAMRSDGTFRRYLCGTQGRVVATTPEQATPPFLRDAWRGDAVTVPGARIREELHGRRREAVLVPETVSRPPNQRPSGPRPPSRPRR